MLYGISQCRLKYHPDRHQLVLPHQSQHLNQQVLQHQRVSLLHLRHLVHHPDRHPGVSLKVLVHHFRLAVVHQHLLVLLDQEVQALQRHLVLQDHYHQAVRSLQAVANRLQHQVLRHLVLQAPLVRRPQVLHLEAHLHQRVSQAQHLNQLVNQQAHQEASHHQLVPLNQQVSLLAHQHHYRHQLAQVQVHQFHSHKP